MQGPFLRKYGVQTTLNFQLLDTDGVDFNVTAAHAAGDTKIMKDEGAEANTTNGFTDEGQGYSIVLTATEMQAARIVVYVVDQSTKVWLDTAVVVETYGNASAMHAVDLDDSVRAGLTALPNAAADAAGGLPISDAGGLDLDAMNTNINDIETDTAEIGTAGAGLTDITINATSVDNIWDEARSGHTTAGTYGETFAGIVNAKCITGTLSTTQATTDLTEATDDHYIGRTIVFVGGVLDGQASDITDYAGATKLLTFTAITEAPVNNQAFILV